LLRQPSVIGAARSMIEVLRNFSLITAVVWLIFRIGCEQFAKRQNL